MSYVHIEKVLTVLKRIEEKVDKLSPSEGKKKPKKPTQENLSDTQRNEE